MLARIVALSLLLIASSGLVAEAVEISTEYSHGRFKDREAEVDPDGVVYGLPFGSSKAEVTAALGQPRGVIAISEVKEALLYGRSHFFVFHRGKLRELIVQGHAVDWTIAKRFEDHPFFDRRKWRILPGIEKDMDFGQVMDVLELQDVEPDYRYTLAGPNSSTTLFFSGWQDQSGPESFRLSGFFITMYQD